MYFKALPRPFSCVQNIHLFLKNVNLLIRNIAEHQVAFFPLNTRQTVATISCSTVLNVKSQGSSLFDVISRAELLTGLFVSETAPGDTRDQFTELFLHISLELSES